MRFIRANTVIFVCILLFNVLLILSCQGTPSGNKAAKDQATEMTCYSNDFNHADDARANASRQRLQSRGYSTDTSGLIQSLSSPEVAVRAEAAFLIGYGEKISAQGAVHQRLQDSSARVRVEAAYALARLGRKSEVEALLIKELQGEFFQDAPLRAARALALLGNPVGYYRVIEAFKSPLASNRMEAIAVLPAFLPYAGQRIEGEIIDPIAILVKASLDSEIILRRDALSTLGKINDTRSIEAIKAALKDQEPEIREFASCLLRLA